MAWSSVGVYHEPSHGWEVKDGRDVIVLHVPEYKANEMRVVLRNGTLTITGNRKLQGFGTEGGRFEKKFRISKMCGPQEILAMLADGYLRVTLPPNAREIEERKGCYHSWLARIDKRLAAKVAAGVIAAAGLVIGAYLALKHL